MPSLPPVTGFTGSVGNANIYPPKYSHMPQLQKSWTGVPSQGRGESEGVGGNKWGSQRDLDRGGQLHALEFMAKQERRSVKRRVKMFEKTEVQRARLA